MKQYFIDVKIGEKFVAHRRSGKWKKVNDCEADRTGLKIRESFQPNDRVDICKQTIPETQEIQH